MYGFIRRGGTRGLGLALVLIWLAGCASSPDPGVDERRDDSQAGGYLDYLNAPHAWFSSRLGHMSRQIDSYFGSRDLYEEVSGSYAEIKLDQQWIDSGSGETGADFRVKIDLPRTEQRFKLLLESAADELDPRSDDPATARRIDDESRDANLFAGLRGVLVDSVGLKLSTDAGIKVRTPPEAFGRARLRRSWSLGPWQLRFKEGLFWFDTEGFGQTTELDLDRRLGDRLALRASTRYQWLDETDGWELGHGVALYQILDSRNSLAYEVGFQAGNRPVLRAQQYRIGVRFRRRVHEDWLFLSLVPDIVWARDNGFGPEAGLALRLEVLFGERYLGPAYSPATPRPRPPDSPPGMLARDGFQ